MGNQESITYFDLLPTELLEIISFKSRYCNSLSKINDILYNIHSNFIRDIKEARINLILMINKIDINKLVSCDIFEHVKYFISSDYNTSWTNNYVRYMIIKSLKINGTESKEKTKTVNVIINNIKNCYYHQCNNSNYWDLLFESKDGLYVHFNIDYCRRTYYMNEEYVYIYGNINYADNWKDFWDYQLNDTIKNKLLKINKYI
jgi:hypothetical protein